MTDKIADFESKALSERNMRQDGFWKGRTVFLPAVPTSASEAAQTAKQPDQQVQDTEVTEGTAKKLRRRATDTDS